MMPGGLGDMRVVLKGIHTTTKRLRGGRIVRYYYLGKGGHRLKGEPGTVEFYASYNAAIATRSEPNHKTLFSLISEFRRSTEYTDKEKPTRRAYDRYLKLIEEEFGTM